MEVLKLSIGNGGGRVGSCHYDAAGLVSGSAKSSKTGSRVSVLVSIGMMCYSSSLCDGAAVAKATGA